MRRIKGDPLRLKNSDLSDNERSRDTLVNTFTAMAIDIGTALSVDPATPNKICVGLTEYLAKMNIDRLSDLIGLLEMPGDQPAKTPYP